MQFTRETEYALLGLTVLAKAPNARLDTEEIAAAQKISPTFLKKIFQKLSRARIIAGVRGKRGGFRLARPAATISVRSVIETVEGGVFNYACTDAAFDCRRRDFCRLAGVWRRAERAMVEVFEQTKISDLICFFLILNAAIYGGATA